MIEKIVSEIDKISIDFIYASDFKRTKETALIIARGIGLDRKKIILTPNLRDINLGIYQGGPRENFYKDFPDFPTDFNQKPKNGESLSEARKRITDFVKKIDSWHQDSKILIVSHGEPLWLLEGEIKGAKDDNLVDKNLIKKNYIKPGELRKLN